MDNQILKAVVDVCGADDVIKHMKGDYIDRVRVATLLSIGNNGVYTQKDIDDINSIK